MSILPTLQPQINRLPTELRSDVENDLLQFEEKIIRQSLKMPDNEQFLNSIADVWCCSHFVRGSCLQTPAMLIDLINTGDLFSGRASEHYKAYLQQQNIVSEGDLMAALRHFRRREMVRIAWRDLAGWSKLQETLTDLTLLAECCVQFALDFLYREACTRRGTPLLTDGTPQQLVVIGMGKLGAWELNYSSDIDLIFAYAEDGILPDRKATTYGEFFTRLCRNLIKVLDQVTVDGFVFRTDVRLRPFGDSGPLVMSFDGMEIYYQTQAREWERYAMIKARQIAGDYNTGPQLMAMLQPFVYRRYLDYGAFEELRTLKYKITEELKRKDRMDNVKLGPGGIREIEFVGQAFQLIRGGQTKSLQQREILKVLATLGELGAISRETANQLVAAYCFLRRVENHIQQYQDKQTHDLPKDTITQTVLAYSLGFGSWLDFKAELDGVRQLVHSVFDDVFSVSQQQQNDNQQSHSLWIGKADEPVLFTYLEQLGYREPAQTLAILTGFKNSAAIKRLTAKGASVIDRLMPQLIEALQEIPNPDLCLKRILTLFESVAGRTVYLSLLSENPEALRQLIKLSSASPWISDYLAHYPVLFDELLDTRTLYEPLSRDALAAQLTEQLNTVDWQDEEQLMYAFRKFKQANVLRVAAADIMGAIPVMVVSDYLTFIAEAVLHQVAHHAWRLIADKHGVPPDAEQALTGFGVLGYGKFGGIELGYASDLDMVFLYHCSNNQAMTDGRRPISCPQFYARVGQKIMHILQTKMLCGTLYEVDMRLRPSGNSGLLVSSIPAYETYLRNEAWTWEHQALVRARFIAGDENIKIKFEQIRRNILSLPRDLAKLKQEVRKMREKMRANLTGNEANEFDLKQSKGGIADIEFIVQFNILAQAYQNPQLVTFTDNVRLLESLQTHGFIDPALAHTLKVAYCTYRDRGHRETLQGNRAVVAANEYVELRSQVERIWHEFFA